MDPIKSLTSKYFDDVYAASADPWNFEGSEYEKRKYDDTLAALNSRYANALEVGCSIGVLTERLAARCQRLLGVDVSQQALDRASERCRNLPQVSFRCLKIPEVYPEGQFDLTVLSEVAYYWNETDLARAATLVRGHTSETGQLLLVHWTPVVPDYPSTGDRVHEYFLTRTDFKHLSGHRRDTYRLDLFEVASSSH